MCCQTRIPSCRCNTLSWECLRSKMLSWLHILPAVLVHGGPSTASTVQHLSWQGFSDGCLTLGIFRQWLPLGGPPGTNQEVTAHIQTRDHPTSTHCQSSQDKMTLGCSTQTLPYRKWELTVSATWVAPVYSCLVLTRLFLPLSGPVPLWALLEIFPHPSQGWWVREMSSVQVWGSWTGGAGTMHR